jgi:uncharacterized membrane protein YjfL (UPF0719 family)
MERAEAVDPVLALVGVAKLLFGILVGVVGITLAARMAARLAGFSRVEDGLREGNAAMGLVVGASILAMGILVQHAVRGTFGALDLLIHAGGGVSSVGWIVIYAAVHVGASLGVGAVLLVVGTRSFVRLTPDVDEIEEIRGGNLASALVLAAVLIVLALLGQQGVETMLDGLLPLPTLGREGLVAPG